ncbi:hypothetical protein [Solidesulfovibrio carbinolicus]|uniref:Glycosyl transferase n=1 Tax=Solidesulfovibrio carbinolicus TaxID=296842 RepID=A0A4P6HQZ7_9BACT|nr:hypothetical protein [Solidesulfovibrio carbinolicus]QAZ69154.1 hypothetical protein C3Y92_18675 [Solidesulfovibrio carbinolicus]
MQTRCAFVFATDANYFFLAKGLVLSIEERMRSLFDCFVVDIGLDDAARAWFAAHGVGIVRFDRKRHVFFLPEEHLPPYADAQLCRPFLRDMLPGYDIYLWCDADFWFQSCDGMALFADLALRHQEQAVLCPEHHYGLAFTRNQKSAVDAARLWYGEIFDEGVAEGFCHLPVLNSGFMALHRASPVWTLWAKEIQRGYRKKKRYAFTWHVTEQMALNYVVYSHQLFVPVDPIYNYPCAAAAVGHREDGKLIVTYPPYSLLRGVHLLSFQRYAQAYFDGQFLYRQGAYLEPEELADVRGRFEKAGRP